MWTYSKLVSAVTAAVSVSVKPPVLPSPSARVVTWPATATGMRTVFSPAVTVRVPLALLAAAVNRPVWSTVPAAPSTAQVKHPSWAARSRFRHTAPAVRSTCWPGSRLRAVTVSPVSCSFTVMASGVATTVRDAAPE